MNVNYSKDSLNQQTVVKTFGNKTTHLLNSQNSTPGHNNEIKLNESTSILNQSSMVC